jgi:hypothetical protein
MNTLVAARNGHILMSPCVIFSTTIIEWLRAHQLCVLGAGVRVALQVIIVCPAAACQAVITRSSLLHPSTTEKVHTNITVTMFGPLALIY